MTDAPIALTKWYLDCVDPNGRAVIGYWASLAWHRATIVWQSIAFFEPGRPPTYQTSLTKSQPPLDAGASIVWRAPSLGSTITATRRGPAVASRLLESDAGFIDWACEAPAAETCAEIRGHSPVCGPGYVERLVTTVPPWKLPIKELRWGRWLSSDAGKSAVWIDWQGPHPASWLFVDSEPRPSPTITDAAVTSSKLTLTLTDPVTLHSRSSQTVLASIPALRSLLRRSGLLFRETKWRSVGERRDDGGPVIKGWAIHEVVQFS
jgi:hypothetical protein